MTEQTYDLDVSQTVIMLTGYGFELKGYKPLELIEKWLKTYSAVWIRLAVIEALYQGRYKAVSIEQILSFWSRRKQPYCHFTYEFERLICHNLTHSSSDASSSTTTEIIKLSHRENFRCSHPYPASPEPREDQTDGNPSQLTKPQSVPEQAPSLSKEHCLQITPTGRSIPQFTPLSDDSELYLKLRNVAHHTLAEEEFNSKQ